MVDTPFHKHQRTFEHFIPVRYGGTWDWENLALAHRCCNEYYTDSSSIGFYKYRKKLKKYFQINLKLHPVDYEDIKQIA